MHHTRHHTRSVAPEDRIPYWSDITRSYFGNLEVDGLDDGMADAAITRFQVDDLRVFQVDVPPHCVRRSRFHANDEHDDFYKLLLQLRGEGRVRQRSREFDLHPGDWSLDDPRVHCAIDNLGRNSLLVVHIPRDRLRGMSNLTLHTCTSPTAGESGLPAVLGTFMRSMIEQLPSLPDSAATTVSETLLSLLTATLARRQVEAQAHATLPEVLRARVRHYVQTHSCDVTLDIDQIATALRCSKRHLHRAFEEDVDTLDRYIWRTRLNHARQRLLTDPQASSSIGALAAACGFRTAAHFSRLFKAEFGITPSESKHHGTQGRSGQGNGLPATETPCPDAHRRRHQGAGQP